MNIIRCKKCLGTGYIPQFKRIEAGLCFRCRGHLIDPRPWESDVQCFVAEQAVVKRERAHRYRGQPIEEVAQLLRPPIQAIAPAAPFAVMPGGMPCAQSLLETWRVPGVPAALTLTEHGIRLVIFGNVNIDIVVRTAERISDCRHTEANDDGGIAPF